MPLPAYGVLIGTLSHFTRDDPTSTAAYSHGKLYVDTPAGQYEGAVDVATPTGARVQYRLIRHLNHLALTPILGLPAGWQPLASTRSSGAIDYVRSPLFGAGPGRHVTSASGSSAATPSLGGSCAGWSRFGTPGLTARAIMRSTCWRRNSWAACASSSLARRTAVI